MPLENISVAKAEWFRKPETQAVFACLNREGFEVRVAGGAVRNALLDEPVHEVDFATTARPADTLRLAAQAGIKTAPTGIDHGTVTLIVNGAPFEVTTLRRDVETHGRYATVEFSDNWTEDAARRDFTMNALYAGSRGEVYDPLGGLADLKARLVRFVGDPDTRIREDYLRILRFFRFSAQFAQREFDREAIAAIIRERDGLRRLSRERIRAELLRILATRRAVDAIEIMDESGLLLIILGGVVQRGRFERLCRIEEALGDRPDPILRLAALALFIEEDAARLAAKLRLSVQETNELLGLAAAAPRIMAAPGRAALEACLYRLGPRLYRGRVLLAWASGDDSASDGTWMSAAGLAQSWLRPTFPVSGGDLIAKGWAPGSALGKCLKDLEEIWIRSGFNLSRDALLGLTGRPAANDNESERRRPPPKEE
jgi:tRNA nucleotidyltransferase/poly(A) polymerase